MNVDGEELAGLVVAELLEQRGADAVHRRSVHHALDDQGVQLPPAVVDHHVLPERDRAGARVDLDEAAVGRVGEDQLRAHPPVRVDRLGQRVLVDVMGLETRVHAGRQAEHVRVGGARQLRDREPPVGRAAHHRGAVAQLQIRHVDLQAVRGDPQQLGAHPRGRAHHRAHVGHRELVGVVPGEVEPRGGRGVEAARHADRRPASPPARRPRSAPPPSRSPGRSRVAQAHPHVAVGLHPDHRRLRRARRGASPGHQLVGGEVGARRLHRRGDADAEQPALGARAGLLARQPA